MTPPDLPPARLASLQEAMGATFPDRAFVEDARKIGFRFGSSARGGVRMAVRTQAGRLDATLLVRQIKDGIARKSDL